MFIIQRCKHDIRAANEMRIKKANIEVYFFVIIIYEKTINVNGSAKRTNFRLH